MASLSEAEELFAEAEAAAKPGKSFLFFSAAPDHLKAGELFVQAANAFKGCQEWQRAGECFLRSCEMDRMGGERDDSARKLLSAASCYRKCGEPRRAIEFLQEALDVLLRAGRFNLAASQEKEIAEIFENMADGDDRDVAMAVQYWEKAAARYEGENAAAMAQSCRLKSASLRALPLHEFERAAQIYEDAASSSAGDSLRKYSVRDFLLRAGMCRLGWEGEDPVAARRSIESYPAMDATFATSREYRFLTELLEAVEKSDLESFTGTITDFDRTHALDEWKTKLLLRVKNSIVAQGDHDLDLT